MRRHWYPPALVFLLGVSTAFAAPVAHHQLPSSSSALAFVYDTGGALNLSGAVQIYVNGSQRMVTGAPCTQLLHPSVRIPYRRLVRLLWLADSVRFFALPRNILSQVPNVDMAGHTIVIYTRTGKKRVHEAPDAFNVRFDRVYAALTRAAPFTFAGPPCRSYRLLAGVR